MHYQSATGVMQIRIQVLQGHGEMRTVYTAETDALDDSSAAPQYLSHNSEILTLS